MNERRVLLVMKPTHTGPVAAAAYVPVSPRLRLAARMGRVVVLGLCDCAALLIAGLLAYLLWALPMRDQSAALYVQLAPLMLLFILGYAQAGLYPGFGLGPVETLRRLTLVTACGFLVVAAFSFVLRLPPLYSRVTFTLALAFALVALPALRALVFRAGRRWQWWSEPVVVVGTGERAARIIRRMTGASHFGYRPVAVLSIEPVGTDAVEEVPVVGGVECAEDLAARGIRVALLESRRADPFRERGMVERLQRDFGHVVLLREYDDLPVEGLQIRNLGNLIGIEYTNNLLVRQNRLVKRALDIVLGAVALVLLSPVMLVAMILVKLLDGGPVLFFQDRAGLAGRRVAVPKIRTMRLDAEQRLAGHLAANPVMKDEWKRRYKIRDDPRLIPIIGRPFRRFSIDELPQLWTVLSGQMSLVGPRPFPDYHTAHFSEAFVRLRQRAPPGITGLWQVTVRSEGSIADQEAWDSYYIRNWSVWLDVYILVRTLATVLSGRGAY